MDLTPKLANQYANYLKQAGRFDVKRYDRNIPEIEEMIRIAKIFGWDADDINALIVPYPHRRNNFTVYVQGWDDLPPLNKISLLNHEAKHIGQARKAGIHAWLWQYFTSKEYRCNYEIDAYLRNIETRYLFGYPDLQGYIKRIARHLKGPYFLDQRHVNRAYKAYKAHLRNLLKGYRSDAERFWINFQNTTKRSINI